MGGSPGACTVHIGRTTALGGPFEITSRRQVIRMTQGARAGRMLRKVHRRSCISDHRYVIICPGQG